MIFFFTLQCLLSNIKMFLVFIKPVAEKQYFKPRAQYTKTLLGLCTVAGSLLAR